MNRGKIFVNFFLATISISNHISLASTYAEGKNFKVFENARIEGRTFKFISIVIVAKTSQTKCIFDFITHNKNLFQV